MGSLHNLYSIGAAVMRCCVKAHGMNQISRPILWNAAVSQNSFFARRHLNTEKETSADEVLDDEPEEGTTRKLDPMLDRSKVIPLETSLRYMDSKAYKETYGDVPVWVPYRRNFKGQFAPRETRRTCIRKNVLQTRNACPICRDEFLVIDYRNVKLLKQFISPYNGDILHWDKTGVCRVRQTELLVAIEKAKDYGTISFDVPIRNYDYSEYYPEEKV